MQRRGYYLLDFSPEVDSYIRLFSSRCEVLLYTGEDGATLHDQEEAKELMNH